MLLFKRKKRKAIPISENLTCLKKKKNTYVYHFSCFYGYIYDMHKCIMSVCIH